MKKKMGMPMQPPMPPVGIGPGRDTTFKNMRQAGRDINKGLKKKRGMK